MVGRIPRDPATKPTMSPAAILSYEGKSSDNVAEQFHYPFAQFDNLANRRKNPRTPHAKPMI
jgi:hypothetical protein